MTRYRLYEIEPCALYGDCQCPPQRVVRCEGCTGGGTREVRTDIVVEGPSSSSWVSFMASDGFPGLRPRDEDGYYPVEVPDE